MCPGLRLKPYNGEISGLELQPVTPYQWSEAPEASQASHYLPHIGSHIQQVLHDKKYCMFDARRYKTLLTVSGMYYTSCCRQSLACMLAFLLADVNSLLVKMQSALRFQNSVSCSKGGCTQQLAECRSTCRCAK